MLLKEFKQIVEELLDELPEEFFRELSGGVLVSEAALAPDYAQGDDLFVLGQYSVFSGVRQIVIYKGSFDRAYPKADADEARSLLRGILRHEFRHHLESRAGLYFGGTLIEEDRDSMIRYYMRHKN